MVMDSWFGSLWSKGASVSGKAETGILAFEVAGLMSKAVSLWNCLSDKEFVRLREEILDSVGIQKLVTDNDDHVLVDLVLNEIIENFGYLARSVARLGKRCLDPVYHRFENFINDPFLNGFEWFGWEYRWKKMERKVKKMERFVAVTMQLTPELEVLAELEQTLRRMKRNESDKVKLPDFQHKVMWQRHQVRNLRETSPWIRSYDYVVRLLVRSLFTILERIKDVFGLRQMEYDFQSLTSDILSRSNSFSVILPSSLYPSEDNPSGSSSSDPLARSVSRSALSLTGGKNKRNNKHVTRRFGTIGSFKGCIVHGSESPVLASCKPISGGSMRFDGVYSRSLKKMENSDTGCNRIYLKLSLSNSKLLLAAPPYTLGDAALALHYANVIILIEKLVSSPQLIGLDARDDLYNMLPTTITTALRTRLKPYAKSLGSSVHDSSLASEWSLALLRILEWLAPLAHNTTKWHSARNFEQQHVVPGPNVFLVQTLHFANRAKTEAAIMELLVGLNYLCRVGKEQKEEKTSVESSSSRTYGRHVVSKDDIAVCKL